MDHRKLKLLLIARDFSQWGNPKQLHLINELSKTTDAKVWHEPGNIHEIIRNLNFKPDFILIFYYKSGESICPPICGLGSLDIPCGAFVMDLHHHYFTKGVKEDNIKVIFSCYRDSFYKRFPNLIDKMKWLPHHVTTDIFHDYQLTKDIDMLMLGSISASIYPLRYKIRKTLLNYPNFVYRYHPGYREVHSKNAFVHEKYAKEINRAKLFFTCDSKYHYPVRKYMEVPACKTLLLAPESQELYDLGFQSGENFVAINEHNFLEKAEYYLQNDKERERIAENGFNLIQERHTTAIRARELVKMIEEILTE